MFVVSDIIKQHIPEKMHKLELSLERDSHFLPDL